MIIKERYTTQNLPSYMIFSSDDHYSLMLDTRQDQRLRLQGLAREFTNRIQRLRKNSGLNADDKIMVFYEVTEGVDLERAMKQEYE